MSQPMTPGWYRVSEVPPPKDTTFILALDGYWVRAKRGNKEYIVAEWLGENFTWHLNDVKDSFWYFVPDPPDTKAVSSEVNNV